MRPSFVVLTLACFVTEFVEASAQVPTLPGSAHTHWKVARPEEIVGWVLFDPGTVESQLPLSVRFITAEELAAAEIGWARDYLSKHPTQGHWGISFLEIVRMGTFTIDGQAPDWPDQGAAALWLARVASSRPAIDLGPGQPFLALDFWMPDSAYVVTMREKGHYATYGNVRLYQDVDGQWHGTIDVDGLHAVAECLPIGPVTGGGQSTGMQSIYPPLTSAVTDVVRVAFAGHHIRECEEDSAWILQGSHPVARGIVLGPSDFQFGYDLQGGAYSR